MIKKAIYGTAETFIDVTSRLQENLISKKTIPVNNYYFGKDPCPGSVKNLTITLNSGKEHTFSENSICILESLNEDFHTINKLGIFYTNNKINKTVTEASLTSIKKAKDTTKNVTIIVCPQEPGRQSYFPEVESMFKSSNHANIVSQILQALNMVKKYPNYKYVSFLEHDVLYPENYFDYSNLEIDNGRDCVWNDNFIGLCKDGFQKKIQNDTPLHQMTMKYNFAINFFEKLLLTYLRGEYESLEPSIRCSYTNSLPSVHINHNKPFTSHFNIYSKSPTKNNEYWGSCEQFTNLFS